MKRSGPIILIILILAAVGHAQTKIDEYEKLISDDEYFRLLNLADKLKEDSGSSAAVVMYAPARLPRGAFLRYFYGVGETLVRFGISGSRVRLVYGGQAKTRRTELWVLDPGQNLPDRAGRSVTELIDEPISRRTLFDWRCLDCDLTPFIDQLIFGDGIDHCVAVLTTHPNVSGEFLIGRVAYVSQTRREQAEIRKRITDELVLNGKISKARVRISFTRSNFAMVYLITDRWKQSRNKSR
jgi:hypothetical protein